MRVRGTPFPDHPETCAVKRTGRGEDCDCGLREKTIREIERENADTLRRRGIRPR